MKIRRIASFLAMVVFFGLNTACDKDSHTPPLSPDPIVNRPGPMDINSSYEPPNDSILTLGDSYGFSLTINHGLAIGDDTAIVYIRKENGLAGIGYCATGTSDGPGVTRVTFGGSMIPSDWLYNFGKGDVVNAVVLVKFFRTQEELDNAHRQRDCHFGERYGIGKPIIWEADIKKNLPLNWSIN